MTGNRGIKEVRVGTGALRLVQKGVHGFSRAVVREGKSREWRTAELSERGCALLDVALEAPIHSKRSDPGRADFSF